VASAVPGAMLRATARRYRYRLLGTAPDGQLKFVRNPWGFFGSPLLHIGITVVIAVSLYVALTSRQGTLILAEGEQHDGSKPWAQSEHGLFATPLQLPGTLRLDMVRVYFDGKQQPVEVLSDLSITDPSGKVENLSASINRILSYRGLRIYHSAEYGNAFAVTFTDKSGVVHSETIEAHHPLSPADAGYSDEFAVDWSPQLLSAKYYADVDRLTLDSSTPELVLRAALGGKETSRVTLKKGTSAPFGEFQAQLVGVSRWAKLIIVDTRGMSLVFSGFGIIMLGGLLQYVAPPRELIAVRQPHDCYAVFWKAASFKEFFLEERDALTADLQGEGEL
jgi:cytochrome c biogenesis protein ResB